MEQQNQSNPQMRYNNPDDAQDIFEMSKELIRVILNIFEGNEKLICLNAITNSICIVLEECEDNREDQLQLIEHFCKALIEVHKRDT
jgi:hypothetical protein